MSTKKAKRLNPITIALDDGSAFVSALPGGGEAFMDALPAARKELARLKKIERIVKEMFDDGELDPYPSSDTCSTYLLRKATKWARKEKT